MKDIEVILEERVENIIFFFENKFAPRCEVANLLSELKWYFKKIEYFSKNSWDEEEDWFDDNEVFVVKTVCEEQLKPNGCQFHNVNCCDGSVINKHVSYWDTLVN